MISAQQCASWTTGLWAEGLRALEPRSTKKRQFRGGDQASADVPRKLKFRVAVADCCDAHRWC